MPIKAIWNNTTIALTDNFKIVEGKYYFPPDSVLQEHLQKNGNQYVSRWKGVADYYDVMVGNKVNKDAAWVYHSPEEEVKDIKGYFSFWNGVEIEKIEYDQKKL